MNRARSARIAVVTYLIAIAFGAGGAEFSNIFNLLAIFMTVLTMLMCPLRSVCIKVPTPDVLTSIPMAISTRPDGVAAQWASTGTPPAPFAVAPQCVLANYRIQHAAISSWAARPLDEARVAAQGGDVAAQALIAQGLVRGVAGLRQDFAEALPMLQTAASRCVAESQASLTTMHAHGLGLPVDSVMAARLYALAVVQLEESAAGGFGPARKRLIGLASEGVIEADAALRRLDHTPAAPRDRSTENPLIVTRVT